MTGLLLLLTLASPWTGAAFTVDEDGLQMGPWFPLLQSVVLLCYLFVTIVILRHRSVLRRREFVFLLLYILIPLAGGLSRIVLPNIVLVNAGFTVATLLILMNVQFEHEVMLKEQEKQLAEGRIDIMLSRSSPTSCTIPWASSTPCAPPTRRPPGKPSNGFPTSCGGIWTA